jgi:predicted ATPase
MKINHFSFEEKSLGWRLEETHFERLTLLVGASGVGKTRILSAIVALQRVAQGEIQQRGRAWRIGFSIGDSNYIWEGEFEAQAHIKFEKLYLQDALILNRTADEIVFNGAPTVRLPQKESCIFLLRYEPQIEPIAQGFARIVFSNYHQQINNSAIHELSRLMMQKKEYDSLKKIQESQLTILGKLYLCQTGSRKTFERLKQRFCDIFPQVENLRIAPSTEISYNKSSPVENYPIIQIKEKSVDNWIIQHRISAGMLRTLLQIAELYLCADDSILLIDEFENSLGINCIDQITSDIQSSRRGLQFILSSHNPYIINAISPKYWKLITRADGIIRTQNIDQFDIGNSRHSAFMQLLQLEAYQTGCADTLNKQ